MSSYSIHNNVSICNSFIFVLLGLVVGVIIGAIVVSETYNMEVPNNLFYHYGGLIGGLCTLFAACIAGIISYFLYQLGRQTEKKEEEKYHDILKIELLDVYNKLSAYVCYYEERYNRQEIKNIDGQDRAKANECEFKIPEALNDYHIISKLDPSIYKNIIEIRDCLKSTKNMFFKDNNINIPPVGLYQDCKKITKLYEQTFGPRTTVP